MPDNSFSERTLSSIEVSLRIIAACCVFVTYFTFVTVLNFVEHRDQPSVLMTVFHGGFALVWAAIVVLRPKLDRIREERERRQKFQQDPEGDSEVPFF